MHWLDRSETRLTYHSSCFGYIYECSSIIQKLANWYMFLIPAVIWFSDSEENLNRIKHVQNNDGTRTKLSISVWSEHFSVGCWSPGREYIPTVWCSGCRAVALHTCARARAHTHTHTDCRPSFCPQFGGDSGAWKYILSTCLTFNSPFSNPWNPSENHGQTVKVDNSFGPITWKENLLCSFKS